jgi:hypothetical protein
MGAFEACGNASALDLLGQQNDFVTTRFLKSIKFKMSFPHSLRTTFCLDVQSLNCTLKVEVKSGEK